MAANQLVIKGLPADLPPSKTWRDHGILSRVRDQKDSVICWGWWVQELVNCTISKEEVARKLAAKARQITVDQYDCYTCGHSKSLKFVKNNGLVSEQECRWRGKRENFRPKKERWNGVKIIDYKRVDDKMSEEENEEALLKALQDGPVIAGIAYDPIMDEELRTGIWDGTEIYVDPEHGPSYHSIVLVGYDTDLEGKNYFEFQNSRGKRFGDSGFGKVLRYSSVETPLGFPLVKWAYRPTDIIRVHEGEPDL
ncbi:hypothetical protein OROMI_019100 [Orobanche minor]